MLQKIKVKDFLDAVDKNGYPWIAGRFVSNTDGEIRMCIMSQAGVNLGLANPQSIEYNSEAREVIYNLDRALWRLFAEGNQYVSTIIAFNDGKALSYEDAKKYAHRKLDKFAEEEVEFLGY